MVGSGYSWHITLKKFFYSYITALVGVVLPFTISFVQDYEWPIEVAIWIPLIIAGLIAFENFWKHRNDGK